MIHHIPYLKVPKGFALCIEGTHRNTLLTGKLYRIDGKPYACGEETYVNLYEVDGGFYLSRFKLHEDSVEHPSLVISK